MARKPRIVPAGQTLNGIPRGDNLQEALYVDLDFKRFNNALIDEENINCNIKLHYGEHLSCLI